MANRVEDDHPAIPELHALVHRSENGVTRAVVAPAWGAAVVALSVQETDWSWPVPVLEAVDLATMAAKPTSYGIPLLAPVPGRTGRDHQADHQHRERQQQGADEQGDGLDGPHAEAPLTRQLRRSRRLRRSPARPGSARRGSRRGTGPRR